VAGRGRMGPGDRMQDGGRGAAKKPPLSAREARGMEAVAVMHQHQARVWTEKEREQERERATGCVEPPKTPKYMLLLSFVHCITD